ncbi:MAG: SpoIIE family protein phosphatase [Deinococcota bacterium]
MFSSNYLLRALQSTWSSFQHTPSIPPSTRQIPNKPVVWTLSLRQTIILLASSFFIVMNVFAVLDLRQDYVEQLIQTEAETADATSVLKETTLRIMQTSDFMLTIVADELATPEAFALNTSETQMLFAQHIDYTPFVQNIILLDADGNAVNNADGDVDPNLNLAHRDYYQVHRDGIIETRYGSRDHLFVSTPIQGALTGTWLLTFSRGIYNDAGEFLGVVASIVTKPELTEFFSAFMAARQGEVSLWHQTGQLIVGEPAEKASALMGQDFSETDPLFRDFLPSSRQGTVSYDDPISNEPTITSYEALEEYPLLVAFSMTRNNALAPWRQDTRDTILDTLFRSLILLGGSWLIFVLLSRQQAANSQLARAQSALDITRQLQQLLLPSQRELATITENYDIDIAGYMEPADDVGGDYYDVLPYDGGVRIGIGDVTGHGLESGIVMLMTQTAVRTMLEGNLHEPQQQLDILNRTLHANIERMSSDKSLTFAMCDYSDGHVHISGQHESVLVIRASGETQRIDTIDLGFYLGLEVDISNFIDSHSLHLNPGDGIVLYTDGITEAVNATGEEYGLARLNQVALDHWQSTADDIQQALVTDVKHHIQNMRLDDDITLLVFKRT